jgi:hypothetical protein
MAQKPDIDQGLSDAELLAPPADNVSPATLTRVWELHARHTQEKAQEAVETAVQQHRQAGQKTEHEQEEERRHERVVLEYQETMRAVEQRSDQLLARIDREEKRIERSVGGRSRTERSACMTDALSMSTGRISGTSRAGRSPGATGMRPHRRRNRIPRNGPKNGRPMTSRARLTGWKKRFGLFGKMLHAKHMAISLMEN